MTQTSITKWKTGLKRREKSKERLLDRTRHNTYQKWINRGFSLQYLCELIRIELIGNKIRMMKT